MPNPYYRITVKQTSRFPSNSKRSGSTKNQLKQWLGTYVDQRAKSQLEEQEQPDPLTEIPPPPRTRDGEGRKIVPVLQDFMNHPPPGQNGSKRKTGYTRYTSLSNNRDPFTRTDVLQEDNSPNLWAGGFLAAQFGLAWRPDEQSSLSTASSDFSDVARGINRQKEWIEKISHQWQLLLLSPLTAQKRSEGIRYAINLDIAANQQLKESGIPAALALRVIWQNTLQQYAEAEGFTDPAETLGWIAGFHQDKEHLHLHVALFPTTSLGRPLRLSDKKNSPHPGDQHLTRLVAIANIEAEKFWRKELPDFNQTPAVQLARLNNQPDPPQGIDLQQLLPIYCAHNKTLKHFPPSIAADAFKRTNEEEQALKDLRERIALLNGIPDANHTAIFATAKRHAQEKQHSNPKELERLHKLRKLCLRQIWEESKQLQATQTSSQTTQFAQLFKERWTTILNELQQLNTLPKTPKQNQASTHQPEVRFPALETLLSFGSELSKAKFQSPTTEVSVASLKPSDYWFHWINERIKELYLLARQNHEKEEEQKRQYTAQLEQILQSLNRGQVQTVEQALNPLKATFPLIQIELLRTVQEASPPLQKTVLRQKIIEAIQNNSPAVPAPTTDSQTRILHLQGLRLVIQAAQLQKNEETRLRNTFKTKPHSIPTSTPDYLAAYEGGCLSWLHQILDRTTRPANAAVLNNEINSLTPHQIRLQNPELLWELRQLERQLQSKKSLKEAETLQNIGQATGQPEVRAEAATSTPAAISDTTNLELQPPASSQIRELLKTLNIDL